MKLNKQVKSELRRANKQDSESLFNSVWNRIKWFNAKSEIDDLQGLYNSIASEKVNNTRSKFYIYG